MLAYRFSLYHLIDISMWKTSAFTLLSEIQAQFTAFMKNKSDKFVSIFNILRKSNPMLAKCVAWIQVDPYGKA